METTSDICLFRKEDVRLFQGDGPFDRRLNKNRLELKERLKKMGEKLSAYVPMGWTMESGTEYPAVWNRQQVDRLELFFMRSEKERKILQRAVGREIPISLLLQAPSPLYAHASIGFFIDARGIEAGFRIPFLAVADRFQLRKIIESAPSDHFQNVPLFEGFCFGVFAGEVEDKFPVNSPQGWLDALKKLEDIGMKEHRSYMGLVWRFSPEMITQNQVDLHLESVFVSLQTFVQKHVWSYDRDLLGVDGLIQAQTLANQSQWEQAEKERQERLAPKPVVAHPFLSSRDTAAARSSTAIVSETTQTPTKQKQKKGFASTHKKPQALRQQEVAPSSLTSPPAAPTPKGTSQAPQRLAPVSPKVMSPPRQTKNPAVGDVVVLAKGLFAGKEAVVLDILADGQLRVRVGMMQLLVHTADLQQERR